jgi:hypothetical protein
LSFKIKVLLKEPLIKCLCRHAGFHQHTVNNCFDWILACARMTACSNWELDQNILKIITTLTVLPMKTRYLTYYCLFWHKPANGSGPARGKCPQVVTSKKSSPYSLINHMSRAGKITDYYLQIKLSTSGIPWE